MSDERLHLADRVDQLQRLTAEDLGKILNSGAKLGRVPGRWVQALRAHRSKETQ
jgi:hypothetical protein